MGLVIHWSDTFPAYFPETIANFCTANSKQKHVLLHSSLAKYITTPKDTLHVVHASRNLESIKSSGGKRIILFIHGVPDSLCVHKVNNLISTLGVQRVLVSTPDLLHFKNATLFPYFPVDLLHLDDQHRNVNVNIDTTMQRYIFNYSAWKGDLWHINLDYISGNITKNSYHFYRGLVRNVKPLIRRLDYKYSLYPSVNCSNVIRCLRKSRQSFIDELRTIRPLIIDSDYVDFNNGGCLSITALQTLYLGGDIICYLSAENKAILESVMQIKFNLNYCAHYDRELIDVAELASLEAERGSQNIFDGIDIKAMAKLVWKRQCPELF